MRFEDFLGEFSNDIINHEQFLFNAIIAAVLAYLLGMFYIKYGRSIANRRSFAYNFVFLTLTTMLIIYIVKGSVALSLGLVGALSIVRFRAAIKEPEELTYLFFAIGIGLGMGANQPVITVLAFLLFMSLLIIQTLILKKSGVDIPNNMFINISTADLKVQVINEVLEKHFVLVELKRMDHFKGKLDLSYIVETDHVSNIIKAKDDLLERSAELNFSFIEQRNLAV